MENKNLTLQVIQLHVLPHDFFEGNRFDPNDVNKFTKQYLQAIGLKKTSTFDPKLEVSDDELRLVAIVHSEVDQKDSVLKTVENTMKKAQKIAKLVQAHTAPNCNIQIPLPQNLRKDINRNPELAPEISSDGKFTYRLDSELDQAIAQEKFLESQNLVIGDQLFKGYGKSATKLFINESLENVDAMFLLFSHYDKKYDIYVFEVIDRKIVGDPIKIQFSEKIVENKTHLKLIGHAVFKTKNPFKVHAEIHKKFSIKDNLKKIDKIKVLEILDLGLNYDKSAEKIWE